MYRVFCDNDLLFDSKIDTLNLTSAKVDIELNKTGSFTFTIYPENPHFNDLKRLKSIIKVYQDNYLIFRGRILNDEQGFYNEKQVTCEGELAFLLDSVQRPYDFMSGENHTTISDLFTFYINNHNAQVDAEHQFIVGNITVTDPNNYIVRSDSTYLNTFDSIQKKLIDSFGGYLWVRHEADGNYIDYLADFSTISSQKIEFGKNLLTLKKATKGEDIATAIIPLGAKNEESEERITIKSVNNDVDYVFNQEAVNLYGWIFRTVTWDDVTIPSNLLSKANSYLSDSVNLLSTIELTAVDLSMLDADINSFRLGNYIRVSTLPHSLNSNFLVKKLSLNLISPTSNTLTLGSTSKTFTEQATGSTSTIKDVTTQVEQITQGSTETTDKLNDLQFTIQELTEQTASSISQMSEQITTSVSENHYLKTETDELVSSVNTRMTQTENEFNFQFEQFYVDLQDVASGNDAKFQEIKKYIRFVDGNIILGEEGNELTLKIENDRISFLEGNAEVAYFSNRKLYVTDGEYINSLKLGNFAFIPRANGNLSFKKVT